MFADSLQIRDKLVFMLGGAWEWYPILNFPATVTFMTLMVLEAGDVPIGEYSISLEARDPFDRTAGLVKFAIGITQPGDILRKSLSIPFNINVTLPGLWTICVLHEKRELACIPLHIKRGI